MKKLAEIRMRDPFVVPCRAEGRYYLFGSVWHGVAPGFYYYIGTDLENWDGPYPAFLPPADFWGPDFFWAPECHEYRGRHYLFGTCGVRATDFRGTQVFRSTTASPAGPYEPLSEGPVTPREWKALDGTLWVEDHQPWLVFCHEWVQAGDGTICAMRLSDDLAHAVIRIVRELAGVIVTPGTEFGPQFLHQFRINFSQDHDKAVDAMKRLLAVMDRYRKA